ncbi:MAG: RtcB family protein [Anaerovoracaceae bacterium]|nr:RtcB family protein [Anaerovoracaceae bacterium]MDY5756271.1 RtcB family protein [Eubacteriales bacterium]
MIEIKGKVNTAICYATVVGDEAIEQIRRMCDHEFTAGAQIRIMPDVHAGKGCTIGTTMTITDKAVPNLVGVDIGCGMYTVELGKVDIDFEKVDAATHYIPSGRNVWEGRMERFDLTDLRCYRNLKQAKRLERSLGTLGGGNHFIEIDVAADGTKYLVIHSGSRNLGKQVAELYQALAIDMNAGKADYFERRDELIRTYKEQDRRAEIQAALKAMEKEWAAKEPTIPADLCYLYGTYLEDYLHDVEICQQFAKQSRERMAEIILEKTGLSAISSFHTIHNYIDTKEMLLRKGSIAAHDGELVLIPINMRDGSVLARGKGNPDWNFSAPHGAGRLMSRTKARETLDLDAYKKTMEGIYTTSVNESTIDEAPMAYKSLEDIIDVIRESVDVIEILKPIYNFKASE